MSAETLIGIFLEAVDARHRPDQFMRRGSAGWEPIAADRALADVEALALALRDQGIERGDRVALLSENRYEWVVTDLAVLALGAVTVPLYPTLTAEQCRALIDDAEAKWVVVSTASQLEKIRAAGVTLPRVVMDAVPPGANERAFAAMLERGAALRRGAVGAALREAATARRPDDLATIIYTAGTTGTPKGAMLTHGNIASNVHDSMKVLRYAETDLHLSFLPLSHVFERMAGLYAVLACNARIAYADSIDTVGRDALEVHPTILCGVPRFYEKVRSRILDAGRSRPPVARALFGWGLGRGLARARARAGGRRLGAFAALQTRLADRLVLATIRSRLGGRLRFCISGSAPIAPEVIEFFDAIGVPILEGYGLTETSPVICVNPAERPKRGTVGPPIPGLEVRIGDEGEILVRGPNVMRGYWRNEEATREALRDGWFHTGDIGRFDEDGYLAITDRLKDVLVLATGKKVAPQPIEAKLKMTPWVTEAILLGDRRSYVVALIVPHFTALAAQVGLPAPTHDDAGAAARRALVERPEVRALVQAEVDRINGTLARFEQVKNFALLDRELTMEAGELTPKLSVRRAVVMQHFAPTLDALYGRHVTTTG
jgi:long-chain acyl-CoA synthetase